MKLLFLSLGLFGLVLLSGCSTKDGFSDLDIFMQEIDSKPRGRIEALPEVKVYRAFTYSAANRRSPFLPPADVIVDKVEIQQDQSTVKPNLDRAKEVLESFQLAQLKMVGTIQKGGNDTLWALISDHEGGVHMVKEGQFMGRNFGRIVSIVDGRLDLIEIVPNGYGGWLERPRIVALEDEK